MSRKTNKDEPLNLNPDNPNNNPEVDPKDPIPPRAPHLGGPDIVPTAAEYERDAQLEREDMEKAREQNEQARVAMEEGQLPPAAQSLEDARRAREEAKQAKEPQDVFDQNK